jgi:GGDEF domain-containing protein
MNAVLNGKGLLDPTTGLPGRELLIDRLSHALTRARTDGTLVTFVLLRGDAPTARHLRTCLREDQTVARFSASLIAIIAEHPYGSGDVIADRVRLAVGGDVPVEWGTSDGSDKVHEVILRVEDRLG